VPRAFRASSGTSACSGPIDAVTVARLTSKARSVMSTASRASWNDLLASGETPRSCNEVAHDLNLLGIARRVDHHCGPRY
jgi:hypothetical protein